MDVAYLAPRAQAGTTRRIFSDILPGDFAPYAAPGGV